MKLIEVLEEMDLLVPNAFAQPQKIKWINHVQSQLFREFPLVNKSAFFETIPGIALYNIPTDSRLDTIQDLFIDGKPYQYVPGDESVSYGTFTFVGEKIVVHPVPDRKYDAFIHYNPVYAELEIDDLNKEPEFPKDFHELLVLGGAKRIAERNQDYKTAGELESRFQMLFEQANRQLKKPRLKRVHRVRHWS